MAKTPPPATSRHAIAYARFSPRPDAKDCESCESQLADIRIWAEACGVIIDREFTDPDTCGADSWDDRPGLFDAMNAITKGQQTMFVVRDLDRLFRDATKGLLFRAQLEAKGVRLYSLNQPMACEDTPESRMLMHFFLAMGEYQRAKIRAATRAKMRLHQANGRCMGGKPPYGYRFLATPVTKLVTNEDGTQEEKRLMRKSIVPDPEEQENIARIKQLAGLGKKPWRICTMLAQEGRVCRGHRFYPNQIVRVLNRDGLVRRA